MTPWTHNLGNMCATLLLLPLMACPSPTEEPTGGGGTAPGLACDTASPPATSGGDWGPGWLEEEADSTGAPEPPLFDVGMLTDSDPIAWEFDSPSGVYYRSPTAREMSNYDWTIDVLLVVPEAAFVADVVALKPTARVRIPIHDFGQSRPQRGLAMTDISLAEQWTTSDVPFRVISKPSASGAVVKQTLYPRLAYYLPSGIAIDDVPERVLGVISSDRGGLSLFGGAPYEQVHMRGPYEDRGWFELDIGPPNSDTFFVLTTSHQDWTGSAMQRLGSGGVGMLSAPMASVPTGTSSLAPNGTPSASVSLIGQCADGLDNDLDCVADANDYNCREHTDFSGHLYDSTAIWEQSKDFALYGDLGFCSVCDPIADDCSAETELMEYAVLATGILNNVEPYTPYEPDTRVPPFRMTMFGCIAVFDEAAADACDNTMSCALPDYPLINTGDSFSGKLDQVWEVVDFMVKDDAVANRHPVQLAGVVTTAVGVSSAEPGLAKVWNVNNPEANGSFVVSSQAGGVGGAGRTLAHEIGHTLGLDDEDGCHPAIPNAYVCTKTASNGFTSIGFMNPGGGIAPVLDWDVSSAVVGFTQGAIWQHVGPSKMNPRAGGFKFSSCNEMGHPGCGSGLTCSTEGTCF